MKDTNRNAIDECFPMMILDVVDLEARSLSLVVGGQEDAPTSTRHVQQYTVL